MSELALTLLRFGFLALLWCFVLITVSALRRDLQAPDSAAIAAAPARTGRKPPRPGRIRPRNLVVTEGSLMGTVLPLGSAPVTIGRASDNTLVVDDDYA